MHTKFYGRTITFPFLSSRKRTGCSCDGVRWLYSGEAMTDKFCTSTDVVPIS